MEVFRKSMDIEGFQNVETLISQVLQEENRQKKRLKSVSYDFIGNNMHKRLIMEFEVLNNDMKVKNIVRQIAKKKYPDAVTNPEDYGKKMAEKMGHKYIGYIEPKSGKHYIYFFV